MMEINNISNNNIFNNNIFNNNLFNFDKSKIEQNTEKFLNLFNNDKFRIEQIISKGNCPSQEMMIQNWNEIVFLLKGSAIIEIAGKNYELNEGDNLLIEANTPHKVISTDNIDINNNITIWLAVHYE